MTKHILKYSIYLFIVFLLFLVLKKCDPPKTTTVTKTTVNIEQIKDSLRNVILKEKDTVYIDTSKTRTLYSKGQTIFKDSIIYVSVKDSTATPLIRSKMVLEANDATADLTILSFGDIYSLEGVINYPKKTITTETTVTNYVDNSGRFIYAKTNPFAPAENVELGVLFHFKNKFGVISSIEYNDQLRTLTNSDGFVFKAGLAFSF